MIETMQGGKTYSREAMQEQRFREALLVTAQMYNLDPSASWQDVTNEMRRQLPESDDIEIIIPALNTDVHEPYRQKVIHAFDLDSDTPYEEAQMVDVFAHDEVLRQDWAVYLQLEPTASWDDILEVCPEEVQISRRLYRYRRFAVTA